VIISPEPTTEEAAAIVAAVQTVLDQEKAHVGPDPSPGAYRSGWRLAAIAEGLGAQHDSDRWEMRVS
jgi:hypothetical protein